ncbi:IS110 family transposase [Afipia sp. GAS231]|uniref:IS110 family transposase n=1 Tax=Afipia sp. GAS231 TaxID=1882747 RepID=UPI001FCD55B8|nr:IS110 family transposase [Afipia sp. GAS231]
MIVDFAITRMGGAKRYPSTPVRDDDGFRCAQPILVIAKSIIVGVFRKEWPATDGNPRQAAGDRIVPIQSHFWLLRSEIVVSTFIGPGWLPEQLGSLHKAGSTKMTQIIITTAGIDTSKSKLDIAVHDRAERWQVANVLPGWRALAGYLAKAGVTRVGIEATGGYERGVVEHLREAGFTVLVLQPIQVKAFGRVHLCRAKNDALDAVLIAACTATLDPPKTTPDSRLAELAENLTFLDQIDEDLRRFKTRLEHIHEPRLRRMVLGEIARWNARRLAQVRYIAKQLRSHPDLAARFDLVLSIPGIGERTALAIIIRMPELGRVSREEAAALAGLAPFDNDSGQQKGQRHIAGGRARLRRSLFAAALPAVFRWNKALTMLYARLIASGKHHNAALIACARKLLIYANTVVQRGTPWIEKDA